VLEATHHQAHSRGQTDEDDGEADHHGHLDVHLHHAVDVPDRTAGLPTADGVVRGVVSARTLEIFLDHVSIWFINIVRSLHGAEISGARHRGGCEDAEGGEGDGGGGGGGVEGGGGW